MMDIKSHDDHEIFHYVCHCIFNTLFVRFSWYIFHQSRWTWLSYYGFDNFFMIPLLLFLIVCYWKIFFYKNRDYKVSTGQIKVYYKINKRFEFKSNNN